MISIKSDWDLISYENGVREYELEGYFDYDDVSGYVLSNGTFRAFQTIGQNGKEYPVVISIGTFDVFKYDESVLDYPISLIEEVKQLIKEEVR